VTALALRRGSSGRGFANPRALLILFCSLTPTPATAQFGAVVSAYTDQRFRGYSLSDGRPVGILDLSYDAPNGIYAAVSGSVVATRHEGLKGLGLALNGGYATRIRPDLTLDLGVIHSRYSEYSGVASGRTYSEVYAGLAGKNVGTRFSLSPNYIGPARWTLHGELNGHVDLTKDLLVDGTIGALIPLGEGAYRGAARSTWDARLGLAQRLGRVSLRAAFTARGKSSDIYANRRHSRAAFVLGISTAL
jgi:Bacterial protein of unknown function (Gcw_chp)